MHQSRHASGWWTAEDGGGLAGGRLAVVAADERAGHGLLDEGKNHGRVESSPRNEKDRGGEETLPEETSSLTVLASRRPTKSVVNECFTREGETVQTVSHLARRPETMRLEGIFRVACVLALALVVVADADLEADAASVTLRRPPPALGRSNRTLRVSRGMPR